MPTTPRKRTLRFESLEDRSVPAVTATLFQGTLGVTGTVGHDTVTVREANGRLSVTGVPIRFGAQLYSSIPVTWASRVYVATAAGNDVINASTVTRKATLIGGVGNDSLTGGLGNDDLYGRDGHDSIAGGGGLDMLFGEVGDDTIRGEDGNDTLFAGIGNDSLDGGAGDDVLYLESGDDLGAGGAGNDKVLGNLGNDTLAGGGGNDDLRGEDGDDSLAGEAGADTVSGGNGPDTLSGGADADELYGDGSNDVLDGGDGNDSVQGGPGNDRANGGPGNDVLQGEDGSDTLHGDDGDDRVAGEGGVDAVFGDLGNDFVTGGWLPDVVDGGGGSDTIVGGNGGEGGDDPDPPPGGEPGGGGSTTGTVLQVIRSLWVDGSTNDVIVRNTGTTALNGWTVEFDADFEVAEVWNAQLVSHVGTRYTFRNLPGHWATTIRPNAQITFGFNARLDPTDNTAIRAIELNNQPLPDGGGTTNPPPNPVTRGTVTPAVRDQWVNGATFDMTVRNTGTTNIVGWTITFEADFDVTEVWNAQLVGRTGNRYTIRSLPGHWAATVRPGTPVTFGFNVRLAPGEDTGIRNITLNGNAV